MASDDDSSSTLILALALGAGAWLYFRGVPSQPQLAQAAQSSLSWLDQLLAPLLGATTTPVTPLPGIPTTQYGGQLVPVAGPGGTVYVAPAPLPGGTGDGGTTGGSVTPTPVAPTPVASGPGAGAVPVADPSGFELSDSMLAKLSQKTVTEILKLFQDPTHTFQLSPEAAQEWQAYRIGERADFTAWAQDMSQLPTIDPAEFTLTLSESLEETPALVASDFSLNVSTTLDPVEFTAGIEALGGKATQLAGSLLNIGTVLVAVAVVGLVVDMGFTIASNKPDAQKAVDTALDAAMIACLFIPVYGWIIAIVIALVKAILDFFGADIFGGGLSHAQREAIERARYGALLGPMMGDLGHAYSPREMTRVLVDWYHGQHPVSMAVGFYNVNTPGQLLVFAAPGDPSNSAGLPGMPYTWDDLAYYLVWGPRGDLWASAQVGIAENLKSVFNEAVLDAIDRKRPTWQSLMAQGATLNDLDVIADELRLKPDLIALAAFYHVPDWQTLIAPELQPAWARWIPTHQNNSTINQFAQANGYPTLRVWRDAILAARYWPRFLAYRHAMQRLSDLVAIADQQRQAWAASYGGVLVGDAP